MSSQDKKSSNFGFSLSEKDREKLSYKLERLMGEFEKKAGSLEASEVSGYFWYCKGVVAGLNNAYKLINKIDDEYNVGDK